MILVLGILSLVLCQILGPIAWVMGNNAKRDIDANPGRYSNAGNVTAGRICGIIGSVILIAVVVLYGLIFVIAIAGSSSS